MPANSRVEQTVDGQHRLLFDPAFGQATQRWFDPSYWAATGQVRATDGGRGSAWFIDHADQHWVLRHYRRGGRAAAVSRDRYVYTGLTRTRAFREWRLLADLQADSLPAPVPVAAAVERHGLSYSAYLLTVAIPNTQTLARRLGDDALDGQLLDQVGRCVGRFHAQGVWHADLNAHNVLVDAADRIFLIDFDRGERRRGSGWQQGNLDRFARSLNKLTRQSGGSVFDERLWAAFRDGYKSTCASAD